MSKSSAQIEAALQRINLHKEDLLSNILKCLGCCLLTNEDTTSDEFRAAEVKATSHYKSNRDALKDVQDGEVLVQLKLLVVSLQCSIDEILNDEELSDDRLNLLKAYVPIIEDAIKLGGSEALTIFNKENYLAILKHSADFLKFPTEENYKELDIAISKWNENIEKLSVEGLHPEKLSYIQLMKQFTFNIAYIAVTHLVFSLIKVTTLLSVLSPNKEMPNDKPLEEMTSSVNTLSQERRKALLDSKADLKKNFSNIFEKYKRGDNKQDVVVKQKPPKSKL